MILSKHERALIERWITAKPHEADPAEAVLAQSFIPVWAIIGYLEGVDGDVAQTAVAYRVPEEAVEAALAYYRKHQHLIEARLTANAV